MSILYHEQTLADGYWLLGAHSLHRRVQSMCFNHVGKGRETKRPSAQKSYTLRGRGPQPGLCLLSLEALRGYLSDSLGPLPMENGPKPEIKHH